MKKNIYKFILVLALSLLFAEKSFAATSDVLPQMMVGQTSALINGKNTYGGMTGNYAVYNPDATQSYGFTKTRLLLPNPNACLLNTDLSCFVLVTGVAGAGSAGQNSRLMTSRTTVDIGDGNPAKVVYELPALFLGTNIIVGDTFGSIDYSEFSFWGNNMSTTSGATATDALWNLKSYTINPGSQSAWLKPDGTDTDAFKQYYDKVTKLAENATTITDAQITSIKAGSPIYLQSSNIMSPTTDESTKYPEGKTWIVNHDPLLDTANKIITYHGKGTIIVKGNITLADGVKIKAYSTNDKLGIMSINNDANTGTCTFAGKNEIDAYLFCENNFILNGSNSIFKGAIASKNIGSTSFVSNSFFYDYDIDGNAPPGFRYLNIPRPSEVGNKQ